MSTESPPAISPGVSSARRGPGRTLGWIVVAILVLALLGAGLIALSSHVLSGNSDGATVLLEGQAMRNGHLLLKGWSLSYDSFWTIEAPLYAIAVAIAGLRPGLLHVVPSLVALAVIVLAGYLATDKRRSRPATIGLIATVGVLAFPSQVMALFFLQGAAHNATVLWCLIGFVGLARNRFDLGWLAAVLFLAAGMLGDLQTVLLGIVPGFLVGAICSTVAHRWRTGLPMAAGSVAAVVLAEVIRSIAKAVGSFTIAKANSFASGHQLIRNVVHLPEYLVDLLGVRAGPFGVGGLALPFALLHLVAVVFVIGGPVLVAWRLIEAHRGGDRANTLNQAERLDLLLLGGFVFGLATFVIEPIIVSDAYARYLVPAIIFGAVLGGRALVRLVSGFSAPQITAALGAAVIVVAAFASGFVLELRGGPPPAPQTTLAAFLAAHNLHVGVGDYWSSSIVTVASEGHVAVRPVIAEPDVRLVRYDKQSASSWYGSTDFQFLVYDAGAIWNGVDRAAALRSYGRPLRTYAVGAYRVLVWRHPIHVSTIGWSGP